MFAGSANGDAKPVRVIQGQATLLARTSHHISVDPVHDQIVTTNPFAEAILFFRGSANGEEPPVRVIQGPKTMLLHSGVDNISVDPTHDEVFTANEHTDAILVFNREASGDVDPIRIIRGPKTRLNGPKRAEVDPANNLLVVPQMGEPKGILIFNRTDNGNVAPKAIISGPKAGMEKEGVKRLVIYPEGKKIFALVREKKTAQGRMEGGFIGVWNYSDNGDVPPYALIRASGTTKLMSPGGIALNPEAKEIIVDSGASPPSVLVYHVPELFKETASVSSTSKVKP